MGGSHGSSSVLRFGVFEVDLRAGELRRAGLKVKVQDKSIQVLGALLERPGEVVTRKELHQRLWPADTFVDFDNNLNAAISKLREALDDSAENPYFVETLPRRGYRFIAQVALTQGARAGYAPERSVVVLPFENLSPEKEQEFFCDGITEELINALAQVEDLRVVARTSAFALKRMHRDVRQIGQELNVGLVLEGTVRKARDRLRITAQLINTSNGYHLWSQRYDRQVKDVFAIQEDIAQAIIKAVKARLGRGPNRPVVNRYTDNLEAYNFFLKGLYHWHKQSTDEIKSACQCFEQAVQTDPKCAPAHVGIADCYRLLCYWGELPAQEAMPRAKQATFKAVELDASLGAARRALAAIKGHAWEDWADAEEEFLQSIKLNPTDAIARAAYTVIYLNPMGRAEEAIKQIRMALELDPLSSFYSTLIGWALHFSRRFDQALDQVEDVLEMDPNYYLAHMVKGWAYEQTGQFEKAVGAFEKAQFLAGSTPMTLGSLGHCYALSGKKAKAAKLLRDLESMSEKRYVSPLEIALIHVGLADKELALEWLGKAYSDHALRLPTVNVDPRFDSLRVEPGFTSLLGKIGLSRSASNG